ncbi:MAG: MFS transporter [Casimicrobiaceae bacterium]
MTQAHALAKSAAIPAPQTSFRILGALSFSHMVNDMVQSLILAIYPILKGDFHLSFAQIGLITLTYQLTASLLQPLVGIYTDRRPQPYSLPIGMGFTLVGLLVLSVAPNFAAVLIAASLVGAGSAIFHPESSRIARMASGGKHGMAQSFFQLGGNAGSAMGPLLAAALIAPFGQRSIAWLAPVALAGIVVLMQVSQWYLRHRRKPASHAQTNASAATLSRGKIGSAVGVLLILIFSKYFYLASIGSFFTFYLIDKFGLSVQRAQLHLFLFMAAVALGSLIGGPVGDRIGRKPVIWVSILGVAPFTLVLPYADLFWTGVLSMVIGITLSSAFSAILVYAQELIPGKIGMVSGLFFGFAFGMGGLAAAVLGTLADHTSIDFVYRVCGFLPLLGAIAVLLPSTHAHGAAGRTH